MRYEARFVVETHAHLTTLYKAKEATQSHHPHLQEVEPFDNSALCLYDMERYGVDMCLLKPSACGTTNERQAALVDKYPDKFRAFCNDQTLKLKMAREEAEWSLDAAADEVEKALKTGKFVGIGEGIPKELDRKKIYTFKERLDECRTFAELAQKYGVTLDFHDFAWEYEWDPYKLLSRIAEEYPDVSIIVCHGGYSIGAYTQGADVIRKACAVAGESVGSGGSNVYLETGTWPAEYFPIALKDPNVGVTQLIWGGDYGNVPQYIVTNPGGDPPSFASPVRKWPWVLPYQTDWWGWSLHQIHKLRDWVTQDDINLILGGNAARIFKLPVPYERMFLEGRPDIWGVNWQQSMPFIPKDQVINPDTRP